MQGTFTVAGHRVRSSSQRRFVAFRVVRHFDGVRYDGAKAVEIFARSDSRTSLRNRILRQGFHSSRYFVVIDTETGEEA